MISKTFIWHLLLMGCLFGSSSASAGNKFLGVFTANERLEILSDRETVGENFSYDQTIRIRPIKKLSDWYVNSRFVVQWEKHPKVVSLSPIVESETQASAVARQLALEGASGSFALRLGLQEVVWGETLIAPVTDIWQAPNTKNDFFLEPDFRRLPQGSLNLVWANDMFSSEFMAIPVPIVSPIRGVKMNARRLSEFGAGLRLGLRWEDIETKIFYASKVQHLGELTPRTLPGPDSQKTIFFDEALPSRESNFGLNTSLTLGEIVLRLDGLLLLDETATQRLKQAGIFALDFPVGTGNFAVQYQVDRSLKKNKSWFASQLRYPFFDFEPEALFLKGVSNKDLWIKLAIKYLATQNWSLGLEWHKIEGNGDGFGSQFTTRQLANAQLAFSF